MGQWKLLDKVKKDQGLEEGINVRKRGDGKDSGKRAEEDEVHTLSSASNREKQTMKDGSDISHFFKRDRVPNDEIITGTG